MYVPTKTRRWHGTEAAGYVTVIYVKKKLKLEMSSTIIVCVAACRKT